LRHDRSAPPRRHTQSRCESLGFLTAPANLLLEPPQVGLDLGSDDDSGSRVPQDGVDDAACGLRDRDLQIRPPARVQRTEERLDHRRLDAVVNSGAVAGEVAEAQIGADGDADRNEDLGARAGLPGLNPAEIRCIDPGRAAQRRDGDVRVETHPPDVLARVEIEAPKAASGFTSDLGASRVHVTMKA